MDLRFITASVFAFACTPPARPGVGTIAQERASLRAIHMAAGAPPVDLFVGGDTSPAYRDLAFGDSTPYFDTGAGRNVLDVASGGQRILSVELNLEPGRAYTSVVLADRAVTYEGGGLRVVHASPALGRIDLWDIDAAQRIAEGFDYGEVVVAERTLRRIGFDMNADAAADMIFELPDGSTDAFAMETSVRAYLADGRTQDCMPVPEAPAQIRVLHLSPDAPPVDVYRNGARAIEALELARSTRFLEIPSGPGLFEITAAGDTAPVLAVDLDLDPNGAYTAVAFGPLASIGALAIPETLEPPASGIRIRVIHTAFGVGQVDVLAGDTILLENVDYGAVGPVIGAPAGIHAIGLDVDDDATADLIFDLPELAEGASANLFAVADDAGAFILVQLLDGTTIKVRPRHAPEPEPVPMTANVRAIHLSPDAPAVNAFVGGDPNAAVSGLEFRRGTGYLEIPAGETMIAVSAGGLGESILSATAALAADASYTVAVFDRVHAVQALLLEDDRAAPAAGNIRIRAIHTAVGVGTVNILAGNQILYADLEFGTAGDAIEVPATAYTIGLDIDLDHWADLFFDVPALPEGTIANVFAVTDAHGAASLVAQLDDGTTAEIPAR